MTNEIPKPTLQVERFVKGLPFKANRIKGFTPELFETYYEDHYGGAIRALNAVEAEIAKARSASNDDIDLALLIMRQARLMNQIVLQEQFLEGLAEDGGTALEDCSLKSALDKTFGSMSDWQDEFLALTAAVEQGWIALVWNQRFEQLQIVAQDEHLPLAGSTPLVVVDLGRHAYTADFGDDRVGYVQTLLESLNWEHIAETFHRARGSDNQNPAAETDKTQISVSELKHMLADKETAPLVLDIRHDDDRARYTWRIADTEWRDSFKVAEWAGEMPKDKPVVVYCMYGFWVSRKVVEELRAEGIDAHSLEGGVVAWRAMALPSFRNEA